MSLQAIIQLIALAITALGSAGAVALIMAKLVDRWIEERFDNLEKRLDAMQQATQNDVVIWRNLEKELYALRADLPTKFIPREEHARDITRLQGRVEELHNRQTRLAQRGEHH